MLDKDKLAAANIAGLKKVNTGGAKTYELIYSDGAKKSVSRDELISMGLTLAVIPTGFCEPWAEHDLTFDTERLKSRGFVAGEQCELAGAKGYRLYRADSNSSFFKPEMLIAMKYAVKGRTAPAAPAAEPAAESVPESVPETVPESIPEPVPEPAAEASAEPETPAIAEPWEEHDIVFSPEGMAAKGFIRCERAELGGVKGYNFYNGGGGCRFLRPEMAVIMKLAEKSGKSGG